MALLKTAMDARHVTVEVCISCYCCVGDKCQILGTPPDPCNHTIAQLQRRCGLICIGYRDRCPYCRSGCNTTGVCMWGGGGDGVFGCHI